MPLAASAQTSMVLEARRLAALGLRVLPVCPIKRKPLPKGWRALATSDADAVARLWRQWPSALIGAACGKGSNLLMYGHFVVDIDTKNNGHLTLDTLQTEWGSLPSGQFTVKSPGGYHMHFSLPPGTQIKNFVGKDGWGDGIDVRGCREDGSPSGMSIMPPSVRADGLSYAFGPNVVRPYEVSFPSACPPSYLWLSIFNARERQQLAAAGVPGPQQLEIPDPAGWAAAGREIIALEFRRAVMPQPDSPIPSAAIKRISTYVEAAARKEFEVISAAPIGEQNGIANTGAIQLHALLKGASMFGAATPELVGTTHQGYCLAVTEMLPGDRADPWTVEDADELWQRAEPPAVGRNLAHIAFPPGAADEFDVFDAEKRVINWPKWRGKQVDCNSVENAKYYLNQRGITVRYDEFKRCIVICGLHGYTEVNDKCLDVITANANELGCAMSANFWAMVLSSEGEKNRFHAVRDWLKSLPPHDGRQRVEQFFIQHFGAQDTPLNRAVATLFFVALVRRVFEPGCKYDYLIVLQGVQGQGKSEALAALVSRPWFHDSTDLGSDAKVLVETLSGVWLWEAADLSGMTNKDADKLKAMLSSSTDEARAAYDRFKSKAPRQWIATGTTNKGQYLVDETGNRRFIRVICNKEAGSIDKNAIAAEREQLFAEALTLNMLYGDLALPRQFWGQTASLNEHATLNTPFYDHLFEELDGLQGWVGTTSLYEAVGFGQEKRANLSLAHMRMLGAAMHKLGWERKQRRRADDGKHAWGYAKGEGPVWTYDGHTGRFVEETTPV